MALRNDNDAARWYSLVFHLISFCTQKKFFFLHKLLFVERSLDVYPVPSLMN